MKGAASPPAEVLRATAPFSELPAPLLAEAIRSADVVFHPAGTRLAQAGGPPLDHLHVVVKGAVRMERRGEPLQLVEEGETFGFLSLLAGTATLDVMVEEDLVACRIPAEVFRRLLGDARFACHFAAGTADRLRASLAAASAPAVRADLSATVGRLVREPPEWVEAGTPVHAAAARMRELGITWLLVRGDPPGIVTDRDLRNRVLAAGLSPETAVDAVTTRPLRTVPSSTAVHEAWRVLLETGVHHLPVEDGGAIAGVVTAADLLRSSAHGPVELLRRVTSMRSRDRLAGHAAAVAEMAAELAAGRLDAPTIAGFVARVNGALVARILRWAEADLGGAPGPYAWLALGSEARSEQTLLTDQDNALVYADGAAGARDRWADLARRVDDDLEAAGFPPCPGGYMARRWHGPLSEWTERFSAWIASPSPEALLGAGVFMDFRRVGGDLDLAPLEAARAAAGRNPAFLRFLARSALEFRPPPALVLRMRGEAVRVDLKSQAIGPIVFLARCYALEAGSPAAPTLERLEAAARAGLLDRPVAETAAEAFRFLLGLRLRLQLARGVAGGEAAPSGVTLQELSPVERSRVKDALRAVESLQAAAAFHHRLGGAAG